MPFTILPLGFELTLPGMPTIATIDKASQISSLVAKMTSYCDFYQRHRSVSDFPAGVMDVTATAAEARKLALLKAISKEVDVWIRERLSDDEQYLLIEAMREGGVLAPHLPKLTSVKSVQALIKRGLIRSAEEGHIATQFLGERSALLSTTEISSLGEIFDRYAAKVRS